MKYATPKEILKSTNEKLIEKVLTLIPDTETYLRKHAPKFILYLLNTRKSISVLLKTSFYSVVLPSRFIQEHFDALYKSKGIKKLTDLGIVESSNYSRKNNLCREFSLNSEIILQLLMFIQGEDIKNPVTNTTSPGGSDTNSLPANSPLSSSDNTLYSDVIRDVLSYSFADAICINDLRRYCVDRYKKVIKKRTKLGFSKKYSSEVKSIATDYQKYVSLIQRGTTDEKGTFSYKRMFKLTDTGRICEVNGGLQGLSRGCKSFIYKNIPNLNNYDIRSCQLALLSHYAKKLDINTNWIDEYVLNSDAKKEYAKKVGITEDGWKKTILSVVFGSIKGRKGTPYKVILNEKKDYKVANYVYEMWLRETKELRDTCSLWLTKVKKFAKSMSVNGTLVNSVGKSLNITRSKLSPKFISAFLLQGLEARILDELCLYNTKDYRVVSPEYDGAVVIGEINSDVWNSILAKLELSNSNLILEKKRIG